MANARPPALIADPHGWGAVAAIRSLGRQGIPVWLSAERMSYPASMSRYVKRRIRAPLPVDEARFLCWLRRSSARGAVPFAVDDASAWLYARYLDELSPLYRMLQAPADAIRILQDKGALPGACSTAGLATPSWLVAGPGENPELDGLRYPVFVKPRTQAGARFAFKGEIARDPAAARALVERFASREKMGNYDAAALGDMGAIVQPYIERPGNRVYGISGFVGRGGEFLGLRASYKTLQRPIENGNGICFEEAEVDSALAAGLARLSRQVGYIGMFEAEFLKDGAERLLIDFNCRLFNGIDFVIARGLDLPAMHYAAAVGDNAELARLSGVAARTGGPTGLVYCDRPRFDIALKRWQSSGVMSPAGVRRWRLWLTEHRGRVVQPTHDYRDPGPGLWVFATNWAPVTVRASLRRTRRRVRG